MPDVAEKPVTEAAPAPINTTAPASTESPQKGMFDHLAIEKPKTEAREVKPEAAKPAEAETVPTDTTTVKLLAGRFKTPDELEKAYEESSHEGLRLYQEQKSLSAQIKERDAKLAELEDQLKLVANQEPFKEMTKDELIELAGKDPIAAAEYVAEKKLRDRDLIQARQKLKDQRETQGKEQADTQRFIIGRGEYMASQPEKFPHFESLIPNMEKMRDIMGEAVKDRKWAPDIVYLAALGQLHLQTLQKGKDSTEEAVKKAAAESTAIAASTAPGGTSPATLPGGKEDPNSDKSVREKILKAAPSRLFAF